jgi:uncharacterized protein YukE
MGFKAQSDKLRTAATIWTGCSTDTSKVGTDISPAVDQGDKFGVLAGSSGVTGHYNIWVQDMYNATQDGAKNFTYLAAALTAIADTYDETDTTVAESVESLDKRI